MSDEDSTVKPVSRITMNPIRRVHSFDTEERYPNYKKFRKQAKPSGKKQDKTCVMTPEKIDCQV